MGNGSNVYMKIALSIIVAGLIVGGTILFIGNGSSSSKKATVQAENIHNVNIVDGKQIIEINAKGGYSPRLSAAKSNTPTILRFNTNGTFDCSASVRIPSLNISKILPNSGATDIDLGNPKLGTLQGTCGMGMFRFEIDFQG